MINSQSSDTIVRRVNKTYMGIILKDWLGTLEGKQGYQEEYNQFKTLFETYQKCKDNEKSPEYLKLHTDFLEVFTDIVTDELCHYKQFALWELFYTADVPAESLKPQWQTQRWDIFKALHNPKRYSNLVKDPNSFDLHIM